jgi:hypothetical protein
MYKIVIANEPADLARPFAACKVRLQGFSLRQGFAVVVRKSNKDAFVEFLRIHHSTETRNDHQLEQDVEHDLEGKITSRRKRGDTQVNQKLDCKWRCKSKSRNVARLRLRPASISHTFPTRKAK